MGVIRTDKWLIDTYHKPIEICEKLEVYFSGVPASAIYDYLISHGMYQPLVNEYGAVVKLQNNDIWEIAQTEYLQLQKDWNGPSIPIFIFPSDQTNHKLIEGFNGKSGLAFNDKLFLFIGENNTEKEIMALLTHEYNHVCRLSNFPKKEQDYVLLDTIILEGLGENAVRERYGKDFLAMWASYYSKEQLMNMWDNILFPQRNIAKDKREHQSLLYGLDPYPRFLGYCVGFYLVENYMNATNKSCKDLLTIDSSTIAQSH